MGAIEWDGRRVGPTDLFGIAREARERAWLDEPARRFLHHCGICLATDRGLSEYERVELEIVLARVEQLGSQVLAQIPPLRVVDDQAADIAQLETDLAALRLFLASATERVEGYWNRLQRLKRGLPPEPHPLEGI